MRDGVSFLSLGGANSIDRFERVPGLSWWAEEQISLGDAYRAVSGGRVDVVLAHDAPAGAKVLSQKEITESIWPARAVGYANESRYMMRQVVDAVQPKLFFHGHYHRVVKHDSTLKDHEGHFYRFFGYGLDMNGKPGNVAVLHLPSLEVDILP